MERTYDLIQIARRLRLEMGHGEKVNGYGGEAEKRADLGISACHTEQARRERVKWRGGKEGGGWGWRKSVVWRPNSTARLGTRMAARRNETKRNETERNETKPRTVRSAAGARDGDDGRASLGGVTSSSYKTAARRVRATEVVDAAERRGSSCVGAF